MEITKENILKTPRLSGIYAFRNKNNNKYYIGQSLCIRSRLRAHLYQYYKQNTKYPIYRAFLCYGLTSFELIILETFDTEDTNVKQKLDEREIYYINKYNTYVSGYNQTKGGDGGITGYKFSDEQRQKVSVNSTKIHADGRNKFYVYNIDTQSIEEYNTKDEFTTKYNITIYNSMFRNLLVHKKFIIARTKEILDDKIKQYTNCMWINGQRKVIPDNFINYYSTHTRLETLKEFNISNPTLQKWCKIFNFST